MRKAQAKVYWKKVEKRNYTNLLQQVNFNELSSPIEPTSGIFAICGLNGAGKSTIIAAIKDILGITLSTQDSKKILDKNISADINTNAQIINCKNEDGYRLTDHGVCEDSFRYIDYGMATKAIEFFNSQTNLEELVEQNEEHLIEMPELEEISYIVGKSYSECSFVEIDDMNEIDTIPYFKVQIDNVNYDSTCMGIGEHFLFYLFWVLQKVHKDSLLIIEEPETFISISSQKHVMDYIASIIALKGISVILTTHSPFILDKIPNKNICIVSRYLEHMNINTPTRTLQATDYLGVPTIISGTIFVEDNVAKLFLTVLLQDRSISTLKFFEIEAVNGESCITTRLKFPYSNNIKYKFIGIYDGDMRDKISKEDLKIEWPFTFLPVDKPIEIEIKDFLKNPSILAKFCSLVGRENEFIARVLAKIDGTDHHDWFVDFCKESGLNDQMVVSSFYQLWVKNNNENVDNFIKWIDLQH